MKIAILYHSESGNTKNVAKAVAEGAKINDTIEVKTISVDNIDEQFINEAQVLIVGTPTYCGTYTWPLKKWFDSTPLDVSGKLGSMFATEDYLGGGADVAELGLAGMMLVRGMMVYTAGFTKGDPKTHLGAVTIKNGDEVQINRAKVLGQHVAKKALELF